MGFFTNRTQMTGQRATDERRPVVVGASEPDVFQRIRPHSPVERKEAGLSARMLEGLLLKTIKQEGAMTEQELSEFLCLAPGCFRVELQSLYQRQCVDSVAPMTFDITAKGRELARHYEAEDAYVGPAPVSFQEYCRMVLQQAARGRRLTQEEFDQAFAHLPAPFEMRRMLKEAFNSGQVLLFWGPPGNGKSLWSDSLHALLKDPVLLPHAFEFNNRVVQYYDPAYHKLLPDLMKQEEDAFRNTPNWAERPDRRWLICKAPLVTVGTEFRVEHFEIAFDGKFNAPPHLKANNGIFIFDDLGRQTQDHNMILNQFIYPLEQRETIIKFAGGSSIRAPYRQRLILSTNLNVRTTIDDAFARRLLYQVLVDRPTDESFKQIIRNVARGQQVTDETLVEEMVRKLLYWYKRDGRVIRAADPRNLFRMLDAALDEGEKLADVLTMDLVERVYRQYPLSLEKDATGYSVTEVTEEEFRSSFQEEAAKHGVPAERADELAGQALAYFRAQGRFLRPVDAGNLFAMADGARPAEEPLAQFLTSESLDALLAEYPNFTPADADRMRGACGLGRE